MPLILRISSRYSPRPTFKFWGYGFFLGAIALSLIHICSSTEAIINGQGFALLRRFFGGALHPELSREFLLVTLNATLTTFSYAVCGTFLSLGLGFVGGLFCAQIFWTALFPQLSWSPRIWRTVRLIFMIPRSIHEVVWGLLLINLWGLDPLVALGAIAIPFGAIVAKIFSEILDDTPREGFAALLQAGSPPLSALLYGILPQALFNLVSYAFYRFECSLRSAAVLGIVGAGGLGYEIFLSLQSLKYDQLWTLFYALILLNGGVDWLSGALRDRLGCTSRLDLNSHRYRVGFRRRGWLIGTALGSMVLVGIGFWSIQPDWSRLWSPRIHLFWAELVQDWATLTIDAQTFGELSRLSLQTLEMSILAIAIAGLGGLIFACIVAKQKTTSRPQCGTWRIIAIISVWTCRIWLLGCRAIPAPIWALVILFVLFPGIVPGAIALGVHNLGILGRLMAEVIENVEQGPLEALRQAGSPASSVFLYGTLPLTLPSFLSYTFYRWEVCLRETIIVGLVGAGGLGRHLTEQLSSFDYGGVTVTLSAFLLLTALVDIWSGILRQQDI